jgi:hypothetical protein
MIAALAYHKLRLDHKSDYALDVAPSIGLGDSNEHLRTVRRSIPTHCT